MWVARLVWFVSTSRCVAFLVSAHSSACHGGPHHCATQPRAQDLPRAGLKKLMMDLDAVLEKAQAHRARLAVPAAGCEAERLLASVQAHAQPQASPPPQHVPADHHMLPAFSNRLICRLHPIEVANTKALLEKPYTVGTMCSGTDVPVMALASFQQA